MPEQTDKRRSWWGILAPDRTSLDSPTRSQPDLLAYPTSDSDLKSPLDSQHDLDTATGAAMDGNQTLRRVSSKMDIFKKSTLPKRIKSKGGSKFATITTAFSSSRPALPNRAALGSVSSTTMDLHHFEKTSLEDQVDTLVFMVTEQHDLVEGERERDVAYCVRAEGISKIILLTRRISDFLEFDEKVRIHFPKSRPALPLLDDRRKSFLVSTRQFFFPRKNTTEKLEAYLRKVATHEPLRSSTIFQEFLAVQQEGDLVHSKEQPYHAYSRYSLLNETKSEPEMAYHEGTSLEAEESKAPPLSTTAEVTEVSPTQALTPAATPVPTTVITSPPPSIKPEQLKSTRGSRNRPGLPQIQERKKASIDDFDLIKVLGKGCMGKVMLVREKRNKKLFALKAISKEWVILQREIEHTKSERNILANVALISHPFLIKLRHSFQSNSQLFMVLDYYPGGDIATQLAQWHKFEPARCLFYAAEIVLGIEELHRQGIVYRDLKPENILLALDGHIVLTDFGLSKQFPTFSASSPYLTEDKTNTFCGTAEYLAPEILKAAEYSYEVDWWSLGTLLFEMLTGITPFWAENHAQMYQRVLEDDLEFPLDIDPNAANFIAGLLERDPDYRLGCHGPAQVKEHPYFDSIDWDLAMQKKLPCPYVPELISEEDLSNFDDAFLTMTPRLSPGNHTLSNSIQNCFQGYSYTDKMASTLPRNDSKIRLDRALLYPDRSKDPTSSVNSSYIDGFDHEAPVPPPPVNGSYAAHGRAYGNGLGNGNGNGHGYSLPRSPLQRMDLRVQAEETEDSEEEEFYQYRPLTQLYAPPSAAISSPIETKAQPTSPALTPPTVHAENGRMASTDRISTTRLGAAADILRGYSERTSVDTQRHNSTGSSHSSGTIGRRLSRGYV